MLSKSIQGVSKMLMIMPHLSNSTLRPMIINIIQRLIKREISIIMRVLSYMNEKIQLLPAVTLSYTALKLLKQ